MHRSAKLFSPLCFLLLSTETRGDDIAFVKDNDILLTDFTGKNVRELKTDDPRDKALLRWDASRRRLSYLADRSDKEVAHLVVIDLSGKILTEAAIPPITDPPEASLRFVDELWWLPNGQVRVMGSVNPMNCVLFDEDIETQTASNWHDGVCGQFKPSPDGKHMISQHKNYPAAEEDQVDFMQLDDKEGFYNGNDPKGVFWLAGPEWSADSQKIALIEKEATTGEVSLVILTLTGDVTRIAVTISMSENAAVMWDGDKVVVSNGHDSIVVASRTKYITAANSTQKKMLQRASSKRHDASSKAKLVQQVVRDLHGRDGVALNPAEANQH